MSIKIEKLKTNSFEMEYFHFGSGNKTMVIMPGLSLNSVMQSAEFVAEEYKMFADRYKVYVFDRRKKIPEGFSVDRMARDTSVAFDALGIKDADVYGISLGGMIAEVLAIKRPDLVGKLLLGSTCAKLTDTAKDHLLNWIALAESNRVTELVFGFAEAVYSEKLVKRSRKTFSYLADIATVEDVERFIASAKGLAEFDITDELGKISCPVLVMGGGADNILGRESIELLAEKTHGELYIYEGAPHSVYDEDPDFRMRTLDFFEKA